MGKSGSFKKPTYKVKLGSGRILGPLDLERIKVFIKRDKIVGTETAREYPKGTWRDINEIPEIAELFIAKVQAEMPKTKSVDPQKKEGDSDPSKLNPMATQLVTPGETVILPQTNGALPGATQIFSTSKLQEIPELLELPSRSIQIPELPDVSQAGLPEPPDLIPPPPDATAERGRGDPPKAAPPKPIPGTKTELRGLLASLDRPIKIGKDDLLEHPSGMDNEPDTDGSSEKTMISDPEDEEATRISTFDEENPAAELPADDESKFLIQSEAKKISEERTIIFRRPPPEGKAPKKAGVKDILKIVIMAGIIGNFLYENWLQDPPKAPPERIVPIKPQLPTYITGKSDPKKSMDIYGVAMKSYVSDTVVGYRQAADKLRESASYDIGNVKALAMLASSYLNLIDSSNKDDTYFSVMSKLIDMSRAKSVSLPETVIANVEFFIVVNKPEAAQNLIIDYTKTYSNYGLEMFYYLAYAYYMRGDAATAARYLTQIPDKKAFSAKVFYLRGLIAEKLKDTESALNEYQKALVLNRDHAKSHLRIADILNKRGSIKESATHIEFIMTHVGLLSPKDLGLAYYLHGQLEELNQKLDVALGDIERAVKLDPENHDYILELYTLRARAGDSLQAAQKQARMYYYLGEGEKLLLLGKYQDALIPLLQARQANDESSLPPVKIGDMFTYLHDVENAKINYKIAATKDPNNIKVWSKYINALIQSYEWEDATKAMDRFRNLPVPQSSIDKAAADMYERQGLFVQAQTFYKKAMARDSIDPDVYIAYGKSLMATKNFKDAPFFFALGLRFDPLNVDAILNTAKCVAETESIDRAISMLQDELQRGNGARAEFLSAIAEFQIQKGSWDQAQDTVNQATQANSDYAYPWKLQAQIYMNREGQDKDALDRALFAYKSYSERNASDPSGYLERYKIFIKKTNYEKAKEELNRIYEIYPRYPNLHFYLGALYSLQGNHKVAAEEFRVELANNPNNANTLVSYGKELLELGDSNNALVQFNKAMLLAPQSSDAKQNAGWASFKLKNFQAAVVLFRSAIELDKANPTLYKRLGIVYREIGDTASACSSFKKYLEMEPDASDKAEFQGC